MIQYLCDANRMNHHEEADVKIVSYLLKLSPQKNHIQILADDIDIHYCSTGVLLWGLQACCTSYHE